MSDKPKNKMRNRPQEPTMSRKTTFGNLSDKNSDHEIDSECENRKELSTSKIENSFANINHDDLKSPRPSRKNAQQESKKEDAKREKSL